MGGEASGFPCYDCGHLGPHDINAYWKDYEQHLVAVWLHCRKCECLWLESLDEPELSNNGP